MLIPGRKKRGAPSVYLWVESAALVVPAPVLPKPLVLELAEEVPAVVVSTIGAIAEESIGVVTVVESTVEGVVSEAESLEVWPLSVPLLQAVNAPAIAMIANTFFIFLFISRT
jgi:hypothetical protein